MWVCTCTCAWMFCVMRTKMKRELVRACVSFVRILSLILVFLSPILIQLKRIATQRWITSMTWVYYVNMKFSSLLSLYVRVCIVKLSKYTLCILSDKHGFQMACWLFGVYKVWQRAERYMNITFSSGVGSIDLSIEFNRRKFTLLRESIPIQGIFISKELNVSFFFKFFWYSQIEANVYFR